MYGQGKAVGTSLNLHTPSQNINVGLALLSCLGPGYTEWTNRLFLFLVVVILVRLLRALLRPWAVSRVQG